MAKIVELYQYPVAGMAGFSVESLLAFPEAIVGNRHLAVVLESQLENYLRDRTHIPLRATQTNLPELTLFQTAIKHGEVMIKFKDEEISTGLSSFVSGHPRPFVTDEDTLPDLATALKNFALPFRVSRSSTSQRWAVDGGDRIASWLSNKLGKKVRLVKAVTHPEAPKHHFTWYTDLHLITQASLHALGVLAGKPVDQRTMRANVILAETEPWEERLWQTLLLGGTAAAITNCLRCGYIAIDPDTGKKATRMDVLNAVQDNFELEFGVYAKPSQKLHLRVGDEVTPQT